MQSATAAVMGIEALIRGDMTVRPLQALHAGLLAGFPAQAGSLASGWQRRLRARDHWQAASYE